MFCNVSLHCWRCCSAAQDCWGPPLAYRWVQSAYMFCSVSSHCVVSLLSSSTGLVAAPIGKQVGGCSFANAMQYVSLLTHPLAVPRLLSCRHCHVQQLRRPGLVCPGPCLIFLAPLLLSQNPYLAAPPLLSCRHCPVQQLTMCSPGVSWPCPLTPLTKHLILCFSASAVLQALSCAAIDDMLAWSMQFLTKRFCTVPPLLSCRRCPVQKSMISLAWCVLVLPL
jgi:hypothetical protein